MKTMSKWITRLVYGLLFSIPLMLATYILAQASPPVQTEPAGELNCQSCHPAFHEAWKDGAHGKAVSETFLQAWEAQGKSGDCLVCHTTGYDPVTGEFASEGITCESCHNPIAKNHPTEPMPADRSSRMCGNCHAETYFEWQVSKHRDSELDCIVCHDPHGNSLKAEDSGALCASCHRERASNYTHSQHSQQGLTCTDCHLAKMADGGIQGHARQDHSFFVSLNTCNSCHAYQMHDPVAVHPDNPEPTPAPDAMTSIETASVVGEPDPVSPMGFATLAGLIGMAFGIVLAPWLERWYRRIDPLDKRG
jgi:predicted CXXCH cytochrome family protein